MNKELVELCEDVLAAAKEGRLQSMAFVGIYSPQEVETAFCHAEGSHYELLGGVTHLAARIERVINSLPDKSDEEDEELEDTTA